MPHAADMWALSPAIKGPETKSSIITVKNDKISCAIEKKKKGRGLDGVKLIVRDKYLGMLEAVSEVFPAAKYQCCTVHFYRNVFSVVPRSKVKRVAKMLKAIHAQENKKAVREKAGAVVAQLKEMKLPGR